MRRSLHLVMAMQVLLLAGCATPPPQPPKIEGAASAGAAEEAALHAALATIDSMQPGYAIKLLRLQNEMIQTFDRYQRGNKQTVEVRYVNIHSGGLGVVGIINPPDDRDAGVRE